MLTVHDPRGFEPAIVDKRFAKRHESLDGKTVYFVLVPFANTPTFMDELRERFAERLPKTEVRIVSATGRDKMTVPPDLRKQIVESADAAVVGIGL